MNEAHYRQVHEYIEGLMKKILRPPQGLFRYPSLCTTAGEFYAGGIFAWDTHHMTLRFAMGGAPEMMKYFLLTMLFFQHDDGFVPCFCGPVNGGTTHPGFHAQPFLAQNAAIYLSLTGDLDAIGAVFEKLTRYLDYWLRTAEAPPGLFRWRETWMSGFDNEIAGTLFPTGAVLPPDLPSLLFLECRAMGCLSRRLKTDDSGWERQAEQIRGAVNEYLWDEDAGLYAPWNLLRGQRQIGLGDGGPDRTVGKYAFVSCPALLPLFAGVAPPERAKRMIRDYVLSEKHFRSRFGIRSLSRSSEYYNNARWGNPPRFSDWNRMTNSNWQGPVWVPLNWFVFHALLRYGFREEAAALADDTVELIWKSLRELGFMRENYDAETGEGLYADHFASWNILADTLHRYLNEPANALPLFPWESA